MVVVVVVVVVMWTSIGLGKIRVKFVQSCNAQLNAYRRTQPTHFSAV
jgi:hypothetical protein